jgi:dipeptidase E
MTPKLFLYSLTVSSEQHAALAVLAGREQRDIKVALIENAADIIPNSEGWVQGIRKSLREQGYQVEPVDVRNWQHRREELRSRLMSSDVIWVDGGHTYYLRWMLRESGADEIIRECVRQGKVYAGWSAGAIVAGPTTQYFDAMGDDPAEVPDVILEGLGLTRFVVVPHIDNTDFMEGAMEANFQLTKAGFKTVPLGDTQVLVIDGDECRIV